MLVLKKGPTLSTKLNSPKIKEIKRIMKVRMILFVLALSFVAAALCVAADDAFMGTWKLNEAKSKIPAGMGKNTMVVYAADGENVKITVDGVDGKGAAAHSEWTGKFDGKDY